MFLAENGKRMTRGQGDSIGGKDFALSVTDSHSIYPQHYLGVLITPPGMIPGHIAHVCGLEHHWVLLTNKNS